MSQRTIIFALCGLVLLLVGVVIGQNLPRPGALDGLPLASPRPAETAQSVASTSGRPQAPLSSTEYWITPPQADATRTGFSAWVVLRPRGNFVLERCHAPDYAIPAKPGVRHVPVPLCESIIDGVIVELSENQLAVRAGNGSPQTFRYSLSGSGANQNLVLDFGKTVKLVPGSKNSLLDRLLRLPSDEEARNRYMRKMFEVGVARACRGAPQPVSGRPVP